MLSKARKILIVSASVGAGHNQAAKALQEEFTRRCPAAKTVIADFMAEENSYLSNLLKEAYLKMIDLTPEIYDILYRLSQAPWHGFKAQNILARALKRSMMRLVVRHRPELVVCTHPFACGAAAFLRRAGKMNIPLVAVITDFVVHNMWVYNEVDLYFAASEEMKNQLTDCGIDEHKVHFTGIPIGRQFSQPVERLAARSQLELNESLPVILIMGGGLGLGPASKAFQTLSDVSLPMQLVIVAGKNAELRHNLQEAATYAKNPVKVLGYTPKIRELMAASDLLITKPGALTISEALAMELPMLFYDPIPGQEEDNAAYVAGKGAAVWVQDSAELSREVVRLLTQPELLAAMKTRAGQISRPDSVMLAVEKIEQYLGKLGVVSGV